MKAAPEVGVAAPLHGVPAGSSGRVTRGTGFAILPAVNITPTPHGLRLSQHGVVISELRTSPGPTHSVFDVLAALMALLAPAGRIGVLGFAGGGMMAPLAALSPESRIETVDLDRAAYDLFRRHCPTWTSRVNWRQADAAVWLRGEPASYDLLLDDLSISADGDVIKPAITWEVLPALLAGRLGPGGVAVFNLLLPPGGKWQPALRQIAARFPTARLVHLDDFENRILIAGSVLPSARRLGVSLRRALAQLQSRQADRFHLRHLRG